MTYFRAQVRSPCLINNTTTNIIRMACCLRHIMLPLTHWVTPALQHSSLYDRKSIWPVQKPVQIISFLLCGPGQIDITLKIKLVKQKTECSSSNTESISSVISIPGLYIPSCMHLWNRQRGHCVRVSFVIMQSSFCEHVYVNPMACFKQRTKNFCTNAQHNTSSLADSEVQ